MATVTCAVSLPRPKLILLSATHSLGPQGCNYKVCTLWISNSAWQLY